MKRIGALLAWGLASAACLGGSSEGRLRSSCVDENVNVSHTLPDRKECASIGYTDCPGEYTSDCIDYCAFGLCQAAPCKTDADCAWVGAAGEGECAEYVVEGDPSFGLWCRKSACPKGTVGCPCLGGACTGESQCSGGQCVDTCPSGCRVKGASGGSVCCGGAFCSGDCIGTPCCSSG